MKKMESIFNNAIQITIGEPYLHCRAITLYNANRDPKEGCESYSRCSDPITTTQIGDPSKGCEYYSRCRGISHYNANREPKRGLKILFTL